MKKFVDWMQSKKGKVLMGYIYGFGAAVVLIGALFKLTHWLPGQAANIMLAVGLGVEALIFILSSFEFITISPTKSPQFCPLEFSRNEYGF